MVQLAKFQGVQTKVDMRATEVIGTYHGTQVCRWSHATGKVTLNSGGYRTYTTKMRMNQFAHEFCNSRFHVVQENGIWYVITGNIKAEFYDGMVV
jgi:hypothetical protein